MVGKIVRTALVAAAALIASHSTAQAQTASCGVVLDKTVFSVGSAEGNWIINVTTDAACAWSATSDSDWLVVKSTVPTTATGSGYAKVRAVANTTSAAKRTGHFFVNGVVYTVTQSGCGANCAPAAQAVEPPPCTITLDKTALSVGQTEANWTITVTAPTTCAWTAKSDSDWLVVKSTTPAVPAGNGTVKVRAVLNLTTPSKRVGHVSVNGVAYTVTQGGCGTSCTGSTPQPEPQPLPDKVHVPGALRILQYNTHHGGYGSDGVYSPDRIVAQAMKANPDVVTMNEIEQGTSWSKGLDQVKIYEQLFEKATGYNWYAVFVNHNPGASSGNGNLILSTFPFITSATPYALPVNRSAVDATIDVGGRVVNIISTHLDAENATYRKNEIAALLPWAVTFAEDRIILGDYNAWPETTEITNMTVDYVDTWKAAVAAGTAKGDGITHGSHRIDYIFLSKKASFLKLASMETFKSKDAAGVTPSDHEPVLAVFNVQ
jgi:endonuclease/exonuclease/phosphatase family metal-dependent hydrolase